MKKIVALILTDTHLHKNNYELVSDIFKQAIVICKEKKIKNIFHLGDFFTSREAQPLLVLKEAKEIFNSLFSANINISIIPGNHDKVNLDSQESYLDIFSKECFLIDKEEAYEHSDLNIIWLPYFKENSSYLKRLNNATEIIRDDKKNILLTHIAINGVRNNDGSAQENDIKQNLFKKFDKVIVGHFHSQQDIDNIFYIGSSHQNNYGEDNIKGFTLLFDDGSHEFIKSKFPEYIKIKVDIDDEEKIKEVEKKYANSKDNIRIVFTGNKEKLQAFNKSNLIDKGLDIKFESDEINSNIDISNREILIYDRSNLKEAYNKFIEINSIDDKEFGQEYLDKIL